jgi:hypothetical protein
MAERGAAVGVLARAKYGKDKVRVFRVVRDATRKVHDVVEYNVTVLVEGAIETRCGPRRVLGHRASLISVDDSYTQADNTVVVATDSSAPPYMSIILILINQTVHHECCMNPRGKHSEEYRKLYVWISITPPFRP